MGLLIRSSQIHAAGCYTTSRIRKGTYIVEYTGPRMTIAEGDAIYENLEHTFLFGLKDGKHVIDGHGTAAFINHSCDPNCETDEEKGRVWIIAARDISPGEELTYDYNLYDGVGDAPCFCGAKSCRGSMYSEKELRKKKANRRKRKASDSVKRKKRH